MPKIKLTQECGQRWYRPRSWRVWDRKNRRYYYAKVRLLGQKGHRIGVAFGPIMFFWRYS